MKKQFCPYCGAHLSDYCRCERELERYHAERIEAYENSPESQEAMRIDDLLYIWRTER